MSSRRTLILIGALVTGLISALLIYKYVGGIEEKAQGDAQMVSVVIAKDTIKKGENATDLIARQVIAVGERRQIDLPTDSITRVDEVKSQIAQLDIAPGTVITSGMFDSDAAISETVSNALGDGMVATTLSVDQVHAVAGLVATGDYVNLTVLGNCRMGAGGKLEIDGGGVAGATGEGGAPAAEVETVPCGASLYQKARIMGIGRSLGTAASTPVATGDPAAAAATTVAPTSDLITFEVPPEAAQRLQVAANGGGVYMALVRKDYKPKPIPIDPFLIVEGVDGATPYGGDPETQLDGQ